MTVFSAGARNSLLRTVFRAYPFSKGRYRLMSALEPLLESRPVELGHVWGSSKLALDLSRPGLQRSFYFFMPESYERATQDYLRLALRPGMTAIDVGCHVGLLTLLMARLVGPSGRVWGYEPDPDNHAQLEINLSINGYAHAVAVRAAVTDRRGRVRLARGRTGSDHAVDRQAAGGLDVPSEPLSDLLERESIRRVHLLKIDAEGTEDLVLNGLADALTPSRIERIVCEIHSSRKAGPVGGDRIRRRLEAAGYTAYVLDPALARRPYLSVWEPQAEVRGLQNVLFCEPSTLRSDQGSTGAGR